MRPDRSRTAAVICRAAAAGLQARCPHRSLLPPTSCPCGPTSACLLLPAWRKGEGGNHARTSPTGWRTRRQPPGPHGWSASARWPCASSPGLALAAGSAAVATVAGRLVPLVGAPAAGIVIGVALAALVHPGDRVRPGITMQAGASCSRRHARLAAVPVPDRPGEPGIAARDSRHPGLRADRALPRDHPACLRALCRRSRDRHVLHRDGRGHESGSAADFDVVVKL